jgi:hypothetical protein
MVHLAVFAQQCPGQEPSDSRRELEAFSKMSAVELAQKYFAHPPYRLFAIRRLIELGDSAVVPVLQRAFREETEVTRRRFIAAALVSLVDPDGNYYEYVTDGAREAIKSELPFPVSLSERVDANQKKTAMYDSGSNPRGRSFGYTIPPSRGTAIRRCQIESSSPQGFGARFDRLASN